MRIIAGELKGRELKVPKDAALRPMTDRVREGLFSALGSMRKIEGARVLDLYSGTGALSFEALSRGAVAVIAVEAERAHVKIIQANAENFGVDARIKVQQAETLKYLQAITGTQKFEIVLVDPPYPTHPGMELVSAISRAQILAPDGVAVIEHPPKLKLESADGLELVKQREYGDNVLSFFCGKAS